MRPCLRTRKPTPPPSVMPADADRAGVAEARREPVLAAALVYSPAVSPVCAQAVRPVDVDLQRRSCREVEHDPAVGRAVARDAVAAAPDC